MTEPEDTDPTGRKKVFVVDDHPVVREGLIRRINRQTDLVVCGEADSASLALKGIALCAPDLAIVDLSLRESSGLDLIKDLKARHPKLPVLVLSLHDEKIYAARALKAGARGYIMKREATEHILTAIRRILSGQIYLSDWAASRLLGALASGGPQGGSAIEETLTDRELDVFRLIGEGFGTRQIGDRLHVSVKTVEGYREHIKEKLDLESGNELVRHAVLWVHDRLGI